MKSVIHSPIGLVHLISACVALILGTLVLTLKKGTPLHKKIGYLYVASMLTVNITAFGLYHLFGKFGMFHIFAIISLFGITSGMLPMFFKHKFKAAISWHINQMYFSVIGLYCAFVAETSVRLTIVKTWSWFWIMVFGSTLIITLGGMIFYIKNYKNWSPK